MSGWQMALIVVAGVTVVCFVVGFVASAFRDRRSITPPVATVPPMTWFPDARPQPMIVHHIDELTGKKPYRYDALAQYNAERSRGIVHTAEWDALMAKEQARFNAERAG